MMPRADPSTRVALAGLAYAAGYAALTLLLPPPPGVWRAFVADLFLFLPSAAAALLVLVALTVGLSLIAMTVTRYRG